MIDQGRTVLGYHGCESKTAEKLFRGDEPIGISGRKYDWLGRGAYFWEGDPTRAREWAESRLSDWGAGSKPAVVGAVINLGRCLDLLNRADLDLLKFAHDDLKADFASARRKFPRNADSRKLGRGNKMLRYLDCAVIDHLHGQASQEATQAEEEGRPAKFNPFDTVRGFFVEGDRAYNGSGFYLKSHVQIAVRNADCIVGYFRPRSP